MTKLTLEQRKDILRRLDRPMRSSEFRLWLSDYIQNTAYRRVDSLEAALRRDGVVVSRTLRAENGRTVTLYGSSSEPKAYDVALGLCPAGYFCNLTSLYYHGLTNQVPQSIYMAVESIREYPERVKTEAITNHEMFGYFAKTPRVSRNAFKFKGYRIVLTERVSRKDVGVALVAASDRVCPKGSRVTSLERGLIDAIVHPQYNGGIASVVEFYRVGAKRLDVSRLLQIYKALDFRYPYWQAIGFVCDKVGAATAASSVADHFRARNKFYIDHLAKDSWAFDPKWQIYYPKGLL